MEQRQKGHGDFVCHGYKPALLLLHWTTPTRKCAWYPLITDSTMNGVISDSMARVTAGVYNQNIDKH